MNRLIAFIMVSATFGCAFDANRQEDLRYPATLKVYNRTGQSLQVDSIYSRPEYKSSFILNGFSLENGKNMDISISQSTYDGLVEGYTVIELRCSKEQMRIQVQGDFNLAPNSSWPNVILEIVSCTRGRDRQ